MYEYIIVLTTFKSSLKTVYFYALQNKNSIFYLIFTNRVSPLPIKQLFPILESSVSKPTFITSLFPKKKLILLTK